MIQDGDSILVSHPSTIIEKLVYAAVDQGKKFTLYLLGNNSKEFQEMAIKMQSTGLKIIYGHMNNAPYFIKNVDKIFMTSVVVYANGSVLAGAGSAGLAIFANLHQKPVYLFTRTFKFSPQTQIDSLSVNESSVHLCPKTNVPVYHLKYDLVPCNYFSVFVTEIGLITPWSVTFLVRKFSSELEKSSN